MKRGLWSFALPYASSRGTHLALIIGTVFLSAMSSAQAQSQQGSSGPSLDETLSWMVERLPIFSFSKPYADGSGNAAHRYTAVRRGPCVLEIREAIAVSTPFPGHSDSELVVDFRMLSGATRLTNEWMTGFPLLLADMKPGYTQTVQMKGTRDDGTTWAKTVNPSTVQLAFADSESARRFEKAVKRAVTLCTTTEPF